MAKNNIRMMIFTSTVTFASNREANNIKVIDISYVYFHVIQYFISLTYVIT